MDSNKKKQKDFLQKFANMFVHAVYLLETNGHIHNSSAVNCSHSLLFHESCHVKILQLAKTIFIYIKLPFNRKFKGSCCI